MKGNLSDKARLEHIREALQEIKFYLDGMNITDFVSDSRTRFATIKQLEIIGEAANHLSMETRLLDGSINWRAIIALRHILVHEYYGIEPDIIWQIATVHTIDLEQKISLLLVKANLI